MTLIYETPHIDSESPLDTRRDRMVGVGAVEASEWAAEMSSLDTIEPEEQLCDVPMATDSVGEYYRDIRNTPLLTAQQEVELGQIIEAGAFAGAVLNGHTVGQYSRENLDDGQVRELMILADEGQRAK